MIDNFTISIFNNKIFFEIINEIKLFSKFQIKHYEDLDLCVNEAIKENKLVVFFDNSPDTVKINDIPLILISKELPRAKKFSDLREQLKIPFTILNFEKKN